MILIKEGAKIEGLRPEILLGLIIVGKVLEKYTVELVITEGTGGMHRIDSLHYKGLAVDIRNKNIIDAYMRKVILEECRCNLGSNFDMIMEDEGKDNQHWHLEHDPK